MATSSDIVSPEAFHKAGDLEVFDKDGAKVKFSSFYTEKQTLVIFIRHFLCGLCMEYVKALSTETDPSEFSSKGIDVAIIGCGDHSLIKSYVEDTGSKYSIYADPSQKLFDAFGLAKTLASGKKPKYVSFGIMGTIAKGIVDAFKAGTKALKAGDVTQVGGEFLLGPGEKCTWGHRMTTTRDHTEIVDLRKAVGLDAEETKGET